jgi:hyperosmotically inducible protein
MMPHDCLNPWIHRYPSRHRKASRSDRFRAAVELRVVELPTTVQQGVDMNMTKLIRSASGVVVMLASLSAFAQASGTDAMAAPAAAASAHSSKAENRQLGKTVKRALTKNKEIDASNIYVRARDGAIRLTGYVPENAQIQIATDVAQGVSGVSSVDNKLSVRQPGH